MGFLPGLEGLESHGPLHWSGWRVLFGLPLSWLLVLSIGIYMIQRGTREIKKLQESSNGK